VAFEAAGQLAAHLTRGHGVPASEALISARRIERGESKGLLVSAPTGSPESDEAISAPKEASMPRGIYQRKGDPAKPCGYCKRPKTDHTENCKYGPKRKAEGRPRGVPPPARASRKPGAAAVPRDVADPGVKRIGLDFLSALKRVRENLDAKISAVEELVAIL
jgi:hypothetical protein